MKKILLISQNFYPEVGSAANRMKQLFRYFNKHYNTKLLTTEAQYPNRDIYKEEKFWNENDLDQEQITRVKTRTAKYETKMIFRLFLYIETMFQFLLKIWKEKESFDVVYVSSPPIFIALVGLVAKRKFKAKLIVDIRDLWPDSLQGVGKFNSPIFLRTAYWFENKIYKHADQIVINSESFAPYIMHKGVSPEKITFVPNSLTQEEIAIGSAIRPILREPITVIYAGNIGLAQELESFIRMAEHFKNNEAVRFKMIGYGTNYAKLVQEVETKQLQNITVHPPDTRANVWEKLLKADIAFVSLVPHPVFETVIPGKVIDYMGCGLPIIGMVSGYAKHTIEKARTGFIFRHEEELPMYRQLEQLIEDANLRAELRRNGLAYARQHYSWHENFKRIKEVVASC
ncbi:glycosyltransferase family 4 protein [Listeria booriae]|uniref:glycosyltransferase family 4 protein n=1 Tax=Listeria booriae TaxID=1552123 RepID=UPI0016284DD4|nr:glycosyltransferase family 4 protein [Listeria booriae]MBC2368744.1 glycosyltransferase family 4 protein [Listeria booriae]